MRGLLDVKCVLTLLLISVRVVAGVDHGGVDPFSRRPLGQQHRHNSLRAAVSVSWQQQERSMNV